MWLHGVGHESANHEFLFAGKVSKTPLTTLLVCNQRLLVHEAELPPHIYSETPSIVL